MPSAASKAANARYRNELERGAIDALASQLPEPPAQFQPPPPLAGLLPPKRRVLPSPSTRAQSCESCRAGKRACDRTETCSSCRVRDVRCEYIAAAPLRAAIAGSTQVANNRVEITRLRAQVALLLRVLRFSDAELQYLMRRADEPVPFVLPSPWRPVRWAAPPRRMSVPAQYDEQQLEPVFEQGEPDEDERAAEKVTGEEERAEADAPEPEAAPSPPAERVDEPEEPAPAPQQDEEHEPEHEPSPAPTPKRKREREPEPEPEPAHEPSRRRSQRFQPKAEEPKVEERKPKERKLKGSVPSRRSSRLQGGGAA